MAEFFDIDCNNLEKEWAEHERAKAQGDLVEAELDRAIRLAPEKYGIDKVTEAAVQKTILVQLRFRNAQAARIEAKHAMDVAQAAVDTLDHKKYALDGETKMLLAGFFSLAKPGSPEVRQYVEKARDDRAFGPRKRKEDSGV